MTTKLPTFRTSRLTIRPRTMADLEACLAMDRDPAVTRFIEGPWADPMRHRAFVEARMGHIYPAGMGYWTVLAPEGFAGWVLLTPLDLQGPETEIGWRFLRSMWGHGYATEASRPVLAHALTTLALPKVVADIDPANTQSVRVACKLGLHRASRVPYAGRMVERHATGLEAAANIGSG
jgi:RimJ/RimL family protein N-acetyltransferase